MLLNCGVGEDSWESPGLQGDPTSASYRRSVLGVHWRTWCWSWNSNIWPPDAKSWLIWKDPDAGKDWGQEKKGTTEDEVVRWHHWHDGHGFGCTPGIGNGQGGLVCCGSWGCKQSDMTEWLNWTELNSYVIFRPALQSSLVNISEMQIHAPLPELLNPNFLWWDPWNHLTSSPRGFLMLIKVWKVLH